MGEKIENGTIHVGEIIGKTLDGKDIYKFTELGMAENVKIIEPKYKDGDFVVNEAGDVLIFKKKEGNLIYDHSYLQNDGILWILPNKETALTIERHATEAEKQTLLDALAKEGKRWNAEKLCVEDIPKRKFKKGDKVMLKSGRKSTGGLLYLTVFDQYIGNPLTVSGYTESGSVFFDGFIYSLDEDWLEPYEGLRKGDLAIFWNDDKRCAKIGIYLHRGVYYYDHSGISWMHALKFESKEQFEKLIKDEL